MTEIDVAVLLISTAKAAKLPNPLENAIPRPTPEAGAVVHPIMEAAWFNTASSRVLPARSKRR